MVRTRLFCVILFFLSTLFFHLSSQERTGQYTLIVEGMDWGPVASKVVLPQGRDLVSTEQLDFAVEVKRESTCAELSSEASEGQRTITKAYVSDAKGTQTTRGDHVTLELEVAPDLVLASMFHYSTSNGCTGNAWVDYQLRIREASQDLLWSQESNRIIPLVDDFDLNGVFVHQSGVQLNYAHFEPQQTGNKSKRPLIIWLHGGGEGGKDVSVPLLANRAANYASEAIQKFFKGAHVLVPQCPGAWMHNEKGVVTWGAENDVYNEALMALIENFVKENATVDPTRIYVGGCSNGGYMSLKLILLRPDYFAAGFISALAYKSEYLTDEELSRIKNVPLWFIHSKDDRTTPPEITVVPVVNRLKDLGSKSIEFSFYDHVFDIRGDYGGSSYYYPGHWSWIYSHANRARINAEGQAVESMEEAPSLMEWLAAQNVED